jgi:hypothetical protein
MQSFHVFETPHGFHVSPWFLGENELIMGKKITWIGDIMAKDAMEAARELAMFGKLAVM